MEIGGLSIYLTILFIQKSASFSGNVHYVQTVTHCPQDKTEWNIRSAAINCNVTSEYMCLANEKRTSLLEICITISGTSISPGLCAVLNKSNVDLHSCDHFTDGCPDRFYNLKEMFLYPKCAAIGDGCFLAEPSCVRPTSNSQMSTMTKQSTEMQTESKKAGAHSITLCYVSISDQFSKR
uniref:Uncharacterized protein LOC111111347 isoform X2 n=1 Tax=Crassostrea virginica TaxID=6565 RepID=A0A8B8BKX1_CRAVI|nr:uncharacterized protein LOC111111347 isoform X2 [Crassostrea virginica]XP_022303986.1 uncharacterized protein LOC111111347 isoform X2 [Crassostrea virginica]